MSKAFFVSTVESAARSAVEQYSYFCKEGFSHDEAMDIAVEHEAECAICFAGIGSCGRGWCNHA